MHELGLAEAMLRILAEELAARDADLRALVEVRVLIGPMANVERGALEFALQVLAEEGGCPGLGVRFVEDPVRLVCPRCGEVEGEPWDVLCPRCGEVGRFAGGDAFSLISFDMERELLEARRLREEADDV